MEIPKHGLIDLHVHLDGSLSFDMARELAEMQKMEVRPEKRGGSTSQKKLFPPIRQNGFTSPVNCATII